MDSPGRPAAWILLTRAYSLRAAPHHHYQFPAARRRLADTLDRLDLLCPLTNQKPDARIEPNEGAQHMSIRPTRETVESLRLTLARLEQSTAPAPNSDEFQELKRILLARIADLEAVTAMQAQSPVSTAPDELPATPVDALPPLEVVTAEEPSKDSAAEITPESPPPTD